MEQRVLACMLDEGAALQWAARNLRTSDFYREVHQRIFSVLCEVADAYTSCDMARLADHLATKTVRIGPRVVNALEDSGGMAYLQCLRNSAIEAVTSRGPVRVQEWGDQLRDLARQRALLQFAADLRKQIVEAPTDAAAAIELAQRTVTEIGHEARIGSKLRGIGDVAEEVTLWIEGERKQAKGIYGMRTGIKPIDAALQGLYRQRLVLVKGETKFGKSTAAWQCVWETATTFIGHKGEYNILCFVLEGSEKATLRRFVSWYTRLPHRLLEPGGAEETTHDQEEAIHSAERIMRDLPITISDAVNDITGIESEVRNAAMRGPLLGVVIDYAQLVTGGTGENTERRYADIAERLQRLANEVGCPIIVPSQVTKRQDGSVTEKGATAWRDNCTLALHITRGEPGMSVAEKLKSPIVTIACEAARDDAPFGSVECVGAFDCYRITDKVTSQTDAYRDKQARERIHDQ